MLLNGASLLHYPQLVPNFESAVIDFGVRAVAIEEPAHCWWTTAVVFTLIGNTLIALGLLLQKKSHSNKFQHAGQYFISRTWIGGLLVFLSGHAVCSVGMAVGTQTVLSCLNCWCIVATMFIAPLMFNESLSLYKILSVMLLVGGCVWVILHGPHTYRVFTVERLHLNFSNRIFQLMSVFNFCCMMGFAIYAGVTARRPRLSVFQMCFLGAMCAWYSILIMKCFMGLLFTSTHHGDSQFDSWETWALFVPAVGLAASNLHFLNMALAAGDAVLVMPAYEAMSLTGQIVLGGVFFDELSSLSMRGHLNFWLGVFCVIAGIALVSGPEPSAAVLQQKIIGPKHTGKDIPTSSKKLLSNAENSSCQGEECGC